MFDLDTPIGLVCVFRPAAIAQLKELGIDITLEAGRSLSDACAMRDLDPLFVLADLLDDDREGGPGLDWSAVRPARTKQVTWEPSSFV